MKLLAAIILSGMSTLGAGAIRVKHATRRRDLQGARRPQPRFALSLDGTWVLAPETPRGALKDFLVSVGAPRVFAGPLAKAFDADAIELDVIDSHVDDDFAAAVLEGLSATPKTLPCRFLYDDEGSKLFERIWPGRTWGNTIAKIAASNLISDPVFFFPTFYTFREVCNTGELGPQSFTNGLHRYSQNYFNDWLNSWAIWVPGYTVTYAGMPTHLRMPWIAGVSFGYVCLLSLTRGAYQQEGELDEAAAACPAPAPAPRDAAP